MIERAAGLNSRALEAIAELEQRVTAVDGGRLKLEWDSLRGRTSDRVDDLLWWEGGQLLGFLGIYTFSDPAELAGMVAPTRRRRGIGSALLDAALALCRERSERAPLLVVPRQSSGGKALALGRGGTLDHSEHHLVLEGPPAGAPGGPEITLRQATAEDEPRILAWMEQGFGSSAHEDFSRRMRRTTVIELEGRAVGTMIIDRDYEEEAGIFGFVVEESLRGRGIGRAALRQACVQVRADGAALVSLDVDVANDHALGLYTSVGFRRVMTEDYYALPLS